MTLSRRSLITGLISFVTAPAIVRASSLMPVKAMMKDCEFEFSPFYTRYPIDPIQALLHSRIDAAYAIVKSNWEEHVNNTLFKTGTSSGGGLGALLK